MRYGSAVLKRDYAIAETVPACPARHAERNGRRGRAEQESVLKNRDRVSQVIMSKAGVAGGAPLRGSGEVRAGTLLQFPVEVDIGFLVVKAGEAGDLLAFRQRGAVRPREVGAR